MAECARINPLHNRQLIAKDNDMFTKNVAPIKTDFCAEIEQIKRTIDHLLNDSTIHWEVCKRSIDCATFRCVSEDRRGHTFKTEALLSAEMDHIVDLLDPSKPYRVMWDSNLVETSVLQRLSADDLVVHHTQRAQFMGLIAARSFLYITAYQRSSDNSKRIYFGSIEDHEQCPPCHGSVRAFFHPCVFAMEKSGDGRTRVTSILHFEMNLPRVIPLTLIEAAVPKEIQGFYHALDVATREIQTM